jgi:hypothetical protein
MDMIISVAHCFGVVGDIGIRKCFFWCGYLSALGIIFFLA